MASTWAIRRARRPKLALCALVVLSMQFVCLTSYIAWTWLGEPAKAKQDTAPVIRAAVVFLPSGGRRGHFLREFQWLRRSWLHMLEHQPPMWRTDIVLFTDSSDDPLDLADAFDCHANVVRTNATDPSQCIVVSNYTSLRSPTFDYAFGDSVNVLAADSHGVLEPYDYLLRTNLDTFLTPAFATWKPDKFVVGGGAYIYSESTAQRLHRVSVEMSLDDHGDDVTENVGSTWYGPTHLVQECAALTVRVMRYMHMHSFTDEEKSDEYGIKGWPEWHYGVLLLYAGHVAINHCTHGELDKNPDMLDFPTSSDDDVALHAHLHSWQDRRTFSKAEFALGAYANVSLESLQLRVVHDYAMHMALLDEPRKVNETRL